MMSWKVFHRRDRWDRQASPNPSALIANARNQNNLSDVSNCPGNLLVMYFNFTEDRLEK